MSSTCSGAARSQRRSVLFYISGHGLGHLAQTGPVIDAFARRHQNIEIIIVSAIDSSKLTERLCTSTHFQHVQQSTDPGMLMQSALDVDDEATATAYRHFAADTERKLAIEINRLNSTQAIGVFSNVSWLPLLAAAQSQRPAIAMSTLNWADMLEHYCSNHNDLKPLIHKGREAYNHAACFMLPTPAIPMPKLHNTLAVAPIVFDTQTHQPDAKILSNSPTHKIGLISTGGIDMPMDLRHWTHADGGNKPWTWLVSHDAIVTGNQFKRQKQTGLSFPEQLAQANVVVCKPGYGTFTEAVATKTPILYLSRGDWPEETHLVSWAQQYVPCVCITLHELLSGSFRRHLNDASLKVSDKHASATFGGEEQVCDKMDEVFDLQ